MNWAWNDRSTSCGKNLERDLCLHTIQPGKHSPGRMSLVEVRNQHRNATSI